MVFFQNLIDIAAVNAYVVFCMANPDYNMGKSQRRRLFIEELALDMLSKAIRERGEGGQRLPNDLNLVKPAIGLPKRVRCERCPRQVDRKTSDCCSDCGKAICKVHSRFVCNPLC